MHPANQDLAAQVREQGIRQTVQQPTTQAPSTQFTRIRSLQSEGVDDTITPGGGLGSTTFPGQRRLDRSHSAQTQTSNATYPTLVTDSSQEEYEESESEQDPLLTSSNEDIRRHASSNAASSRRQIRRVPSSSSSDAQMISSTEGTFLRPDRPSSSRLNSSFHPQPNAFTHPPASRPANSYPTEPSNYFSATAPMTRAVSANAAVPPAYANDQTAPSRPSLRTSYSSNATTRPRSHTPYNMFSPNHNASVDHDAALRASLSTLLSCAAARRGVPKRECLNSGTAAHQQPQQITQGTLCLIPESELDKDEPSNNIRAEIQPEQPAVIRSDETLPPVRPKPPRQRKSKSKSPTRAAHQKRQRGAYYFATSNASDLDSASLSPTTLWFIGVGALFLGGAVLFTAGYIQGREVGYVEGLSDAGAASCQSDATDSLRGMGRRSWKSASIWGVS